MIPIDYRALFHALHPDFFDQPGIRSLPEGLTYAEMALPLEDFSPQVVSIPVPAGVSFGMYRGEGEALRRAVREVAEDWPQYFRDGAPAYCAYAGEQIASFCLLDGMGEYQGLKIGGPGCVGTVPAFRRQGIGLKMVQNATAILKEQGYDVSWIHYTGVAPWYAKLGYREVLQWDRNGFLDR